MKAQLHEVEMETHSFTKSRLSTPVQKTQAGLHTLSSCEYRSCDLYMYTMKLGNAFTRALVRSTR